jgi:hypothetical protein
VPTFTMNEITHFLSFHKLRKTQKNNLGFCNQNKVQATKKQTSISRFYKKKPKRKKGKKERKKRGNLKKEKKERHLITFPKKTTKKKFGKKCWKEK